MDFVFSRDIDVEHLFNLCPEFVEERESFNINFLCALYRFKYNSCFKQSETLPELMNGESGSTTKNFIENTRQRPWHKTVVDQNTLPTYEAICFHAKRSSNVLHMVAESAVGIQTLLDIDEHGWSWLHGIPTPILDTPENMEKVDLRRQAIVQKCACKKSGCDPTRKYCKCLKNGRRCTILCKCTGCNNVKNLGEF